MLTNINWIKDGAQTNISPKKIHGKKLDTIYTKVNCTLQSGKYLKCFPNIIDNEKLPKRNRQQLHEFQNYFEFEKQDIFEELKH